MWTRMRASERLPYIAVEHGEESVPFFSHSTRPRTQHMIRCSNSFTTFRTNVLFTFNSDRRVLSRKDYNGIIIDTNNDYGDTSDNALSCVNAR